MFVSIVIVMCILLAVALWLHRKSLEPLHSTREDVVAALRNVLDMDGAGNHEQFDLFLGRTIQDPYLESVRKECLEILRHDNPRSGKDLGEAAEQWVEEKLHELQGTELEKHPTIRS